MIFIGVLCLAACVLAQPAVYVSRTTYDNYPYQYNYPLKAHIIRLASEKEGEPGKLIISSIPDAPLRYPLASIVVEPAKDEAGTEKSKSEEAIEPEKEEEWKEEPNEEQLELEEEKEDEEEKLILKLADGPAPVLVRLKPPQFITNFIQSLPISFPYDFPILGPMFGKPPISVPLEPVVVPAPGPAERIRYRITYTPVLSAPLAEIPKK